MYINEAPDGVVGMYSSSSGSDQVLIENLGLSRLTVMEMRLENDQLIMWKTT